MGLLDRLLGLEQQAETQGRGKPTSWAVEVQDAMGGWRPVIGEYYSEARFASAEEAKRYGADVCQRRSPMLRDWRIVESDEPVNYKWDGARGVPFIP